MPEFTSSFIPTLHYFTKHLTEPALRDALSPYAGELMAVELEVTARQAGVAAARRRRDAMFDAVRAAAAAVHATLEPLAAVCVVAKIGTFARPFGAHERTLAQLRKRRPAEKAALVRGMVVAKVGASAAVDDAAKATLDAVLVLDRALDAATGAQREFGIQLAKRNASANDAWAKLVALKRYASVVLGDKPEAAYFRGALPVLLRASRRVRREAITPPPGDDQATPPTPLA